MRGIATCFIVALSAAFFAFSGAVTQGVALAQFVFAAFLTAAVVSGLVSVYRDAPGPPGHRR